MTHVVLTNVHEQLAAAIITDGAEVYPVSEKRKRHVACSPQLTERGRAAAWLHVVQQAALAFERAHAGIVSAEAMLACAATIASHYRAACDDGDSATREGSGAATWNAMKAAGAAKGLDAHGEKAQTKKSRER
jgi:hypothetical protein